MAVSTSSASAGKLVCVIARVEGGILDEFYTERSNPASFYIPHSFERKGTPFVYLLLTNGTPFTF